MFSSKFSVLFTLSVALLSCQVQGLRRFCRTETKFAIGSVNANPFRPEFNGKGITIITFANNALTTTDNFPVSEVGDNPTYLALSRPNLFVGSESIPDGALTRLAFPLGGGRPTVSSTKIIAQRPAHVSVFPDRSNRLRRPRRKYASYSRRREVVLTANVFGGTVSSFMKGASGNMKLVDTFTVPPELASKLSNPELSNRQRAPNPHMVLPYQRGVIVPDLGADLVFYLRVSKRNGKLSEIERIKMKPGDGPRHAASHRSGTVYVINELSQTIAVLKARVCGSKGLAECDRRDILDGGAVENATAAAIRVSDDQRFLYASVRLDRRMFVDGKLEFTKDKGKIAAFKLDSRGLITKKVGEWSSEGIRPRDFFLVDGVRERGRCRSFAAIVNRDTNHLVLVRRNERTGALEGGIAYEEHVDRPTSVLPL